MLAIVLIIVAGLQWTVSGGNPEMIKRAQKRISGALIGLALAVGSYTILYTINPELVEFRDLNLLYVTQVDAVLAESDNNDYEEFSPDSIEKPDWNYETFDCQGSQKPKGVISPANVRPFGHCDGVIGVATIVPEMRDPLCKVGQILSAKGYSIIIKSSYRPFEKQKDLWCKRGKDEYPDPKKRKSYFAVPGFSNHGHGVAVDVHLGNSNGERLYDKVTGKSQCNVKKEYVKILADAFYAADAKFNRYEKEIWHFEYNTSKKSTMGKFTDLPAKCN